MGLQQATLLLLASMLVAAASAFEPRQPSRRVLAHARTLKQSADVPCSAETACIEKSCSSAYAKNATDFPYTLDYTVTGDYNATTFVFSLCAKACTTGNDFCYPLTDFQLRLSDQLISQQKYIKSLATGSLVQQCIPRGPGVHWDRAELGNLGKASIAKAKTCKLFSITVFHPISADQLQLQDLCQQDVQIVDKDGAVLFDQASAGPSCLFILQTTDKSSGYSVLMQKQDALPRPPPPPAMKSSPPVLAVESVSPSPVFVAGAANSPSPVLPLPSPSPVLPAGSPTPAVASSSTGIYYAAYSPSPAPYSYSPSPSPAYSPVYAPSPYPSASPPSGGLRRLRGAPSLFGMDGARSFWPAPLPQAPLAQGRRLAAPIAAAPSAPSYSPAYSPIPYYSASPSPYAYSPPAYDSPAFGPLRKLFGAGGFEAGFPVGRRLTGYSPQPYSYSPASSPPPSYSPVLPSYSPFPGYSPLPYYSGSPVDPTLPLLQGRRLLLASAPPPLPYSSPIVPYYSPLPPSYSPSPEPYSPLPYYSAMPEPPKPFAGPARRLFGVSASGASANAWQQSQQLRRGGRQVMQVYETVPAYYASPSPSYYSPYAPSPPLYASPPSYSYSPESSPPAPAPLPSGRRLFAAAPATATTDQLQQWGRRQLMQVAVAAPAPPAYYAPPSPTPYASPYASPSPYAYAPPPYYSPSP